jgi:uncharacterized protein YciI
MHEGSAVYYVVSVETQFASMDEVVAKAPQELAAHVARSKALHAGGSLLLAGAFIHEPERPLSTMAICPSCEAANEYISGDPFVQRGMVRSWSIRGWHNLFA